MMPSRPTRRIRLLGVSAMYTFPLASTPGLHGQFSPAWVAGPPSPEKVGTPLPATVVISPGAASARSMHNTIMQAIPKIATASHKDNLNFDMAVSSLYEDHRATGLVVSGLVVT
ncbi:MAG: hypothetical protein A3F84_28780 [Candidatus Handelsmanbacteria bacterium RIFCSPLOWO2_12_FULL_64_10]|uniref:Uncharacterized protein n=1 Tax=Handelsmanbacteria sp. (strain RIFCSPLOWO2_12_FULL_64_10) TaxID=1817868 RepID=A0A1F6C6I3_HANXR|nr:MAG: hypothetical protein A3F84_28780 [Candidatus Handelsmanbacteria bacterium RIFCSPLOWO2_12_FULL_64_10]